MNTYESLKAKIRQTALELMERSLSTKEGSVLMSVVEQVEQAETDWLPIATVREAICAVRPHGVDVSTGVEERPGVKSLDKMRAFMDEVRRAESEC